MDDAERLLHEVEAFWARDGRTGWPMHRAYALALIAAGVPGIFCRDGSSGDGNPRSWLGPSALAALFSFDAFHTAAAATWVDAPDEKDIRESTRVENEFIDKAVAVALWAWKEHGLEALDSMQRLDRRGYRATILELWENARR
jgi:hypothetical protein